jgi:hypothetical protein
MRACDPCMAEQHVCPKCLEPEPEASLRTKLNEEEQKKLNAESEKNMNAFLKTLKERSRRTVHRQYEKGTIRWDNDQGLFVD